MIPTIKWTMTSQYDFTLYIPFSYIFGLIQRLCVDETWDGVGFIDIMR